MPVGELHPEFLIWLANCQDDSDEEIEEVDLPIEELLEVELDVVGESDDEGMEADATDHVGEGVTRGIYVEAVEIFSGQKKYCTTMSYFTVSGDRPYFLCHRCFEWFTGNVNPTSRYEHVESHRTINSENAMSYICDSCELPLNQLKLTDCCLLCNSID